MRIIKPLAAFALILIASACTNTDNDVDNDSSANPIGRPNVLLIVVDDMGFADLGSFGGEIETPVLDKLAYGGVRLSNFHAAPVCSVTRSILLTGVAAHKAGLGNMAEELAPNQIGKPGYEGELNDKVITLASILKNNGYATYMAGKWHLGMSEAASPHNRGFEKSFSLLSGGASHFKDMRPAYAPTPEAKAPYAENGVRLNKLPDNFAYSSQFFVDQLIKYLRSGKGASAEQDKPFFAYLAFTTPHWPLQAPDQAIAKYDGRYDAGFDRLREERLAKQIELGILPQGTPENTAPPKAEPWESLSASQKRKQAKAMEIYAAMIDETDVQIGRLLRYLESSGEMDNTLVVFMSDNGAEGHDLGETWPSDHFPKIRKTIDESHDFSYENMGKPNSYVLYGPNWARAGAPAFRLHKAFPTEGGKRVPAFIYASDIKPNRIENRYASVIDIVPTILDYTRVSHPAIGAKNAKLETPSGQSMRPMLSGKSSGLATVNRASGNRASGNRASGNRVEAGEVLGKYFVRKGKWKIVHMPKPYGTGHWQLFDIQNDIGEAYDLSKVEPDITKDLVAEWGRYSEENGVILPDQVTGY